MESDADACKLTHSTFIVPFLLHQLISSRQDTSKHKPMAGQDSKQKNDTAVSTATKQSTTHVTTRRSSGKNASEASQKQQRPKIEEIVDEDDDDEEDDEGDEKDSDDSDDSDESDSDMEEIAGMGVCLRLTTCFDAMETTRQAN